MNKSRENELIKNTGILMIARISTQIVNFLLLPMYTNLLSTQEYGYIDIYTSLQMIIIPFLTLQLEMGMFRFYILNKKRLEKKSTVTNAFFLVLIVMLIISILYIIGNIWVGLQYAIDVYFYYFLLALSAMLMQLARAEGKNVVYGFAGFLLSTLSVFFNVIFIAIFKMNVHGVLLASNIANFISIIYLIIKTEFNKLIDYKLINKNKILNLLNYSVPLVFNQISSWLINYSDRLIIINFWGIGVNGVYSLANKFSNILATFFGVYNTAWSENVIRNIETKDKEKYIENIYNITFSIYLVLITFVINMLPFMFEWFINDNYHAAYNHIPILLLAMFFSGMAATLGSVYIAFGKTKEISITTILAGVCNVVIHLCLLKKFKLYAASLSTLISFALLLLYRILFIKKFINVKCYSNKNMISILLFILTWYTYCKKIFIILLLLFLFNIVNFLTILKNLKKYNTKQIGDRL